MAAYSKAQVLAQGSMEDFAEWAGCKKVYRLADGSGFIAITSQQEEYDMVLNPLTMNAEMVYCQGTYVPFDWDSLYIETAVGTGMTREEALENAKKQMRSGASLIAEPRILASGMEGVIQLEGFSVEEIKAKWMKIIQSPGYSYTDMFPNTQKNPTPASKVRKLESVAAPQNSMFGLNKKPGIWKIHWYNEWQVEITYR